MKEINAKPQAPFRQGWKLVILDDGRPTGHISSQTKLESGKEEASSC